MTAAEVILRRRAREDIDAAHLAGGAPAAAHGMLDERAAALAAIARHPDAGSPRSAELLNIPGLRTRVLREHPYLLFYHVAGGRVYVWRMLHSARDIPESLAYES